MSLMKTVKKDRKIYGNCQVFSPGGHLMFRCDLKKAKWYLNRDLANIVDNDPLTIKLTFEPNGLGNHNKEYGLTEMKNVCVVCGSDEFLTRHHIVPICYRRHFPLEIKSHNFHDVLSVCADCHEKYETHAFTLKLKLADEYGAPISGEKINNKPFFQMKKIANCLTHYNKNIPQKVIKQMKKKLRNYFSWRKITQKRLHEILEHKLEVCRRTHGEIVVSKIDNIQSFIKMWRNHFIENNDCKYLPKNWSIDNE